MLHKMLIFKRGINFSSSSRWNQVQPSAKVEQGIPCSNPAPTFRVDANLELIAQLELTPWNRFPASKFFKDSPSGAPLSTKLICTTTLKAYLAIVYEYKSKLFDQTFVDIIHLTAKIIWNKIFVDFFCKG